MKANQVLSSWQIIQKLKEKRKIVSYKLLLLGHRSLIKKITQTAVINIVFQRIFIDNLTLTWKEKCYIFYRFSLMGHTESLLFPVVLPFNQPTQMATAPDHIHPSALFNDISVPLSLYKELDKRTLKIIHWGTRFWRKRHGATILRTGQKRPGVLTRIKLIKTKNLCEKYAYCVRAWFY